MRVIVPPIKSQGIKTKLVPWIKALVPEISGRWIEPFLGTGVVAFNSGFRQALLSDINPYIIKFYQAVKRNEITPQLVRDYLEKEGDKLKCSPDNGYAYFRTVRDRFNKEHDPMDFLFLSRSGFNGMMRFNKKGEWNIPFCQKPERFSKAYITKIVNQVYNISCLIQPEWEFKVETFDKTILQATKDDIIYCDPPYLGKFSTYYNNWTLKHERNLFELLLETKAKFILSTWHHDEKKKNPMIGIFWERFNIITRDHFYHVGAKAENRRPIVEALVFNFDVPKNIKLHVAKQPIFNENTKKLDLF